MSQMFSPYVVVGEVMFVSGQRGVVDGVVVEGGVKSELAQTINNISKLIATEGVGLADIVKVNLYVRDLQENLTVLNDAYMELMPEPRPARAIIGASELPGNAIVVMDVIVRKVSL